MEFCEGETLREWIEERNKNPGEYPERRREAAEIIKQVLEAVKYVHLKKLFHRDLKVGHILKYCTLKNTTKANKKRKPVYSVKFHLLSFIPLK